MLLHLLCILLNTLFTYAETALRENKLMCKHKYYVLMVTSCVYSVMHLFHLMQFIAGCDIGVVMNYEK
jgi:hypothetical protein